MQVKKKCYKSYKQFEMFLCIMRKLLIYSFLFVEINKKEKDEFFAHTRQGSICFSNVISCIFAKTLKRRQPSCGFWLQYWKLLHITKLRSTLKRKFLVAEQAKAPDDADAYRGLLTHYDAKISLFKEIHPYLVWALKQGIFLFCWDYEFFGC